MALSKIIKEGLKTTAKRGRKGRYAKAAATRKKTMEAKAIAEGRTPKPKKTVMKPGEARKIAEKGRKGDIKSLTAKQKAERSRLITQVKKEMEAAKKGLTEKPKLARMVSTIERKPGEKLTELSLNMVPASKIELDPSLKGYSKKALRRLISTGQAKIVKKGDKYEVKSTGRYSPPASETGKIMGVGSSTQDILTKKGADLTNVPDIRKARGTGRKMPSLRERIEKAKRKGEPTSAKELKQRQADIKSKEMNEFFKTEKEAIKDAGKSIKERIKKIEDMAKKGTISLAEAKRRTKRLKKSAMKEIKYQKQRPKRSLLSSTAGMTITTTRKKGGKVGSRPRGCGAAMRGYGKAMKGSK